MSRNPPHDPVELEARPEPAWLWDGERGRIVWANRAGVAFWSEATLLDLIDRRFDSEPDAVRQIADLARTLDGDECRHLRFVFHPRGAERALTAACSMAPLGGGRTGVLLVVEGEAAAIEHDETRPRLFAALIDALPIALAVFDRHASLVYANAACRDLMAGADGRFGAGLAGWFGDEARARELIEQGIGVGGASEVETVLCRFGPRAHRVTVSRLTAPIHGRLALMFLFEDIEDRRRVALDQEATLKRLAAAPGGTADISFTLDGTLTITAMSPGSATFLGVDGARFVGAQWEEAAPGLGIMLSPGAQAELAAMRRVHGVVADLAHSEQGLGAVFNAVPEPAGDGGAGVLRCTLSVITDWGLAGPAGVAEPSHPRAPGAGRPPAGAREDENGGGRARHGGPDGGDDATLYAIARAIAAHAGGDAAEDITPGAAPPGEEAARGGESGDAAGDDEIESDADGSAQVAAALRIVGGVDHAGAGGAAPAAAPALDAALLEDLAEPALVHRAFSVVGANQRFCRLMGADGTRADLGGANLLTLFADERPKLFALQSRFDDAAPGGADRAERLALRARVAGRGPVELIATIERVTFAGEPAMLMRFAGSAADPSDGSVAERTGETRAERAPARSVAIEGAAAAAALPPDTPASDDELGAVRERERELRAILNSAADGIATLDGDGRIRTFNPSAEAIFARQADDAVGRRLSSLLDGESARTVDAYLQSVGERGVAGLYREGREVTAVRPDATTVPLFVTIGPMQVADGPRFCAVVRDITRQKQSEIELRRARDEATQASSQKSDFLARISHELRTPLNAIIGFSEVMGEEKFGPIANDRYKGYLADIRTSGEHLLSLINDLLDLSKIEAGKLELNFASVGLDGLIQQCLKIMQPQAARERVIMRVSSPDDLPAVVADERALRQILLNLLSNAIKFTPPGGQVIVSTVLDEDGSLQIRIRDTGPGMTASELERALEPFGQVDLAQARSAVPGTGLGLPLTKALTEANRAELRIESTPGAGTLVLVVFPPERVLAG